MTTSKTCLNWDLSDGLKIIGWRLVGFFFFCEVQPFSLTWYNRIHILTFNF